MIGLIFEWELVASTAINDVDLTHQKAEFSWLESFLWCKIFRPTIFRQNIFDKNKRNGFNQRILFVTSNFVQNGVEF